MPSWGVILDSAGNLYGTTESGGLYGNGTVFKLSPSGNTWSETVIYNFTGGSDGAQPLAGLLIDSAGNLYGTTGHGGDTCSCGTVFQLTPTGNDWSLTTLYTFHGADGAVPAAPLIGGPTGLQGTTLGGGLGYGTAFSMGPSAGTWNVWSYPFTGGNGEEPWAGLTRTVPGGYCGTTSRGGVYNSGKVYCLSWGRNIQDIHSFSPTDKAGQHPMGGLIIDTSGTYGTTYSGSAHGHGAVFQMTSNPRGGYYMHVLYAFSGMDGSGPSANMIKDDAGNLYGTTEFGGTDEGYGGTIFRLSPGTPWTETVLHSFNAASDGGNLLSGVVMDAAGNLYGTAALRGAFDAGVVYEYTPGSMTTLASDRNPSVLGEALTLTALVTAEPPRTGVPSGNVQFLDGASVLGTSALDATGHASLTTTALAQGMHTITGTYSGDSNFPASISSKLQQDVEIPGASLSTTKLNFFNWVIGTTSTAKLVRLTNTGSAPLTISSITAGSPFAVSSTTCGSTLGIGAVCKIYVNFTPEAVGNFAGALGIVDNAPTSPQTVTLSGSGVPPAALTPISLSFPTLRIGTTSSPKNSVLTNNLNATLDNIAIATTGDFSVSSTGCASTLPPHGKCAIVIVFTPTATGTRTGQLIVSDTASNSPQTANLMGVGK